MYTSFLLFPETNLHHYYYYFSVRLDCQHMMVYIALKTEFGFCEPLWMSALKEFVKLEGSCQYWVSLSMSKTNKPNQPSMKCECYSLLWAPCSHGNMEQKIFTAAAAAGTVCICKREWGWGHLSVHLSVSSSVCPLFCLFICVSLTFNGVHLHIQFYKNFKEKQNFFFSSQRKETKKKCHLIYSAFM